MPASVPFPLEQFPSPALRISAEARLLDANRAACRAFDLSRAKLISLPAQQLLGGLAGPDWQAFWQRLQAQNSLVFPTLCTGAATSFPAEVTVCLRRTRRQEEAFFVLRITEALVQRSGEAPVREKHTAPVRREKRIAALEARLQEEVEAHERTRQDLETATQPTSTAQEVMHEFLSRMAHELRTPLNAMLGYGRMLANDATLSPQQTERLAIINRSGEQLLALINDILYLSRLEAGKLQLRENAFSLHPVLEAAIDVSRTNAQRKRIDFEVDVQESLPRRLRGDEKCLRKILHGLLAAAINKNVTGRLTFRVTCSRVSQRQTELRFTLAEMAPTFLTQQPETIFEAVQQDSGAFAQPGGTGPGLASIRKLVELLHGKLEIQNPPGKSSRLILTLPLPIAPDRPGPESARTQKHGETCTSTAAGSCPASARIKAGMPPDAQLLVLYEKAMMGDIRGIQAALAQIGAQRERYAALVAQLEAALRIYDMDKICDLLAPFLPLRE